VKWITMYLKVTPQEVPTLVVQKFAVPTLGILILVVFKVKPNNSKTFDQFWLVQFGFDRIYKSKFVTQPIHERYGSVRFDFNSNI